MSETLERQVAGEAFQAEIGEARVDTLVFCTHDLDPSFFEEDVLPVFLGSDLRHTRRTRQLQLDHEIRERGVDIDVYYEGRALAGHEGGGRLGWHRLRTSGHHGGVFHPKIVLALCTDSTDTAEDRERLVVGIGSGNLTRGGWHTNVECLDVRSIVDGERHGFTAGLKKVIDQLVHHSRGRQRPATDRVRAFIERQSEFTHRTKGGVLRPTVIPGGTSLAQGIRALVGSRLDGAHLEVISPFLDPEPLADGAALTQLISTFEPASVTVCRPVKDGVTRLEETTYRAIADDERTQWGALPRGYTRASGGIDAGDRALHAKVYRFWRGGEHRIEIVVAGSHNLTTAAHSGASNVEVSVVCQPDQHFRALLDIDEDDPVEFAGPLAEYEGAVDPIHVPLSVEYDWSTGVARYRWDSAQPPTQVTLTRAGEQFARLPIAAARSWAKADLEASDRLRTSLLSSAVVIATLPDGGEGPLLIEELNHGAKPSLLDGVELTAAEILILWSLPDLRSRLRRIAELRAMTASDEDDVELAELDSVTSSSMFDSFAGLFHAFSCLQRRVDQLVEQGRPLDAATRVYGESFDSPRSVLALSQDGEQPDLALAYVTYACARELHRDLQVHHPVVVEAAPALVAVFEAELGGQDALRDMLADAGGSDTQEARRLRAFLAWFDGHFMGAAG